MTLTHYNTTWTFASTHTYGYFANGEPWIVGPVSLTSVTPNNNATWDESYPGDDGPNSGSSIITVPNTFQGFCTRLKYTTGYPSSGFYYDASLDLSRTANLPVTLSPGQLLVSATGQTGKLNEVVSLTILSEAPPAGSMRPAFYDPTETRPILYNKADLDYGIWPNLPVVPSAMSLAEIDARSPALPCFEYGDGAAGSSYYPGNNYATGGTINYPNTDSVYGREVALTRHFIAMRLCLYATNAEKEKAFVKMVQDGIDLASYIANGGTVREPGGHKLGRKLPVLIAGLALNDAAILAIAADESQWQEDITTFIVQPGDVGRDVQAGESAEYILADVGLPEWGWKHSDDPYSDDRRWYGLDPEDGGGQIPGYRNVQWPVSAGSILVAKLMGAQSEWGHNEAFLYTVRFRERHGGSFGIQFYDEVWDAYWDASVLQPPVISVSGTSRARASYTLDGPRTVTLSALGLSDGFRYSVDGSAPSLTYSAPVAVASSCTFKAINTAEGLDDSEVATAVINILTNSKPAAPYNLTATLP